jgi:endo-1,4-beta-D-glucanase Y
VARAARQVTFNPIMTTLTDPSYHLPAFYEVWARFCQQQGLRGYSYWVDAAQNSRTFLKQCADPKTGLFPDYADFGGGAYRDPEGHEDFREWPESLCDTSHGGRLTSGLWCLWQSGTR